MGKKNKIIVMTSIGVLLVLLLITRVILKEEYKIVIQNNTNKVINGLDLNYINSEEIKSGLSVDPNGKVEHVVSTEEVKGENVIFLNYEGKDGEKYEEIVIGYLEKGYGGKVKVIINEINDNNKLNIEVKNIY